MCSTKCVRNRRGSSSHHVSKYGSQRATREPENGSNRPTPYLRFDPHRDNGNAHPRRGGVGTAACARQSGARNRLHSSAAQGRRRQDERANEASHAGDGDDGDGGQLHLGGCWLLVVDEKKWLSNEGAPKDAMEPCSHTFIWFYFLVPSHAPGVWGMHPTAARNTRCSLNPPNNNG